MSSPVVGLMIDKFLTSLADSVNNKTLNFYRTYLRSFRMFAGEQRAHQISPDVVRRWVASRYGHLSPSAQHSAGKSVCRLFNWAVGERLLAANPIAGYKKPADSSRDRILNGAEYAALVKSAYPSLRDVVKFLWHTGARPQELRAIEAAWIGDRKIVFPMHASKGKRKRRVIYLDSMATGIVRRLAEIQPQGPIFRDSQGRPWSRDRLCEAFRELRSSAGLDGVCAYTIRHTWITRMLERGAGIAAVAAMAGNSPQIMLRVYSHVAENEEHLRQQLDK